MAKTIPLLLTIFFLASVSSNAQKKSDREQSDLIGLVQTVKTEEVEIEIENGKPVEGKRRLSSLETYDVNGNQLVYAYFQDDGDILYKDTFTYDGSGRVIEEQTEHSPYTYLPDKKCFSYDAMGNLVEESGYDLQNKLLGKYSYAYDILGNVIEEESSGPDDNSMYYGKWLRKFRYDENGNRIESATFQREGSALKPYDSRLGHYKQVYLYDSRGKRIATNYIGLDEKLYRTEITRFDDKGNEIENAEYDADGTIDSRTSYAYAFDRQGNWIKQITSEWTTEDGRSFFRPKEIDYRTITYFKSLHKSETEKTATQSTVLQNSDAEDYAVYAAILSRFLVSENVRLVVIKKFTKGYNTDAPDARNRLSTRYFSLAEAEQVTIDDYIEKNRNRHYQLVDELFTLKVKHALVTDAATHAIFAKDCGKGWDAFYKKYRASQGLTTLSKVGFNTARTQALVYVGTQSHCLAGAGDFIILAKLNGVWKVIGSRMVWIS